MQKALRIFNQLVTLALIFEIAFGTTILAAPKPNLQKENEIKSLIAAAQFASQSGYDTKQFLQVAQKIQKFLSDKSNAKILATPLGTQLASLQNRLLTLVNVDTKLKACSTKKKDSSELSNRIRSAAQNLSPDSFQDSPICTNPSQNIADLGQVLKIYNYVEDDENWITPSTTKDPEKKKALHDLTVKQSFENKLYLESMKNALKNHLDLQYRYSKDKVEYKQGWVNYAVDEICPSMKTGGQFLSNPCSDETRKELSIYGNSVMTEFMKSDVKRMNETEVRTEMNARIDRMNPYIKNIPSSLYGVKSFAQFTGVAPISKNAYDLRKDSIARFEKKFYQETGSGTGLLFHTDAMKKAVDPNESSDPTKMFKPFNHLKSDKDVKDSIDEARRRIKSHATQMNLDHKDVDSRKVKGEAENRLSTSNIKNFSEDSDDVIKKMVRTNPVAVAQLLMNSPEYLKVVCKYIHEIERDKKEDAQSRKNWMWVGAIAGGVLLLSGVGSFVGAAILGEATGAIAVISTATTVGNVGLGLVQGTAYLNESQNALEESREFKNSFFSGNGDTQTLRNADLAYQNYEDAQFAGLMTLGLTMLDLGVYRKTMRIGKTGKLITDESVDLASKTRILNQAAKTLNELSSDEKFAKVFVKAKTMVTEEETGKFLGFLSQLDDDKRAATIAKLKKMDETQLSKFMKETARKMDEAAKTPVNTKAGITVKDAAKTATTTKSSELPARFKSNDPYEVIGVDKNAPFEKCEDYVNQLKKNKNLSPEIQSKLDESLEKIRIERGIKPKTQPKSAFGGNGSTPNSNEGITVKPKPVAPKSAGQYKSFPMDEKVMEKGAELQRLKNKMTMLSHTPEDLAKNRTQIRQINEELVTKYEELFSQNGIKTKKLYDAKNQTHYLEFDLAEGDFQNLSSYYMKRIQSKSGTKFTINPLDLLEDGNFSGAHFISGETNLINVGIQESGTFVAGTPSGLAKHEISHAMFATARKEGRSMVNPAFDIEFHNSVNSGIMNDFQYSTYQNAEEVYNYLNDPFWYVSSTKVRVNKIDDVTVMISNLKKQVQMAEKILYDTTVRSEITVDVLNSSMKSAGMKYKRYSDGWVAFGELSGGSQMRTSFFLNPEKKALLDKIESMNSWNQQAERLAAEKQFIEICKKDTKALHEISSEGSSASSEALDYIAQQEKKLFFMQDASKAELDAYVLTVQQKMRELGKIGRRNGQTLKTQ